jgi:hypothetical protein
MASQLAAEYACMAMSGPIHCITLAMGDSSGAAEAFLGVGMPSNGTVPPIICTVR